MKRSVTLLLLLPLFGLAQNKPIMVEGAAPGLYITHTVAPKENYYSIGRTYNISPKEIAPFNNLVLENGLSLGQTVRIPLTASNFLQAGKASADEALVPLYHSVSGKEGLYRVSISYNKVPVETLKEWNNLKADAVSNGTNLVVGWLKVKKGLSSLAATAKTQPVNKATKAVEDAKVAGKADAGPTTSVSVPVKEKPPVPKAETTRDEPVKEVARKDPEPAKKQGVPLSRKSFGGGMFKADYERQAKDKDITGEKGAAAIFKSTSGWEDGKYYCLYSSTTPGTIVKITNNQTGKSVYAKVLDAIPDIEQNTGLLVRISNAAADELGAADSKFDCSLSYPR
jgi:LysM repeat protein